MAVIATAGHVDHGKSALIRALTGTEPDRWAEERRRGLTIDLGYAWTRLDSGAVVSFVDVPGHQRFIGNMLAGLGPTAAVLFVVAADEGWRRQSQEHLLAVDALGIRHGLLVVTRTDLADPNPTLEDARARLAHSSLGSVPAVAVSAVTGDGLPALRMALDRLVAGLPRPRTSGRARLWIDRAFSIRGAGTVVTGTLGEGTLTVDERIRLVQAEGAVTNDVRIRGLQSLDSPVGVLPAVARAAVNIASLAADDVHRGDVLLTGDWPLTTTFDARLGVRSAALSTTPAADSLPDELMLHVGTAALQVRLRPLGDSAVRVQLPTALPLVGGDRAILRNPGTQHIVTGLQVADVDPPQLRRRGAARIRATQLGDDSVGASRLADEVHRRGWVRADGLERLGLAVEDDVPGVRRQGAWLVSDSQWRSWATLLRALVSNQQRTDPLEPGVPEDAAVRALDLPVRGWLAELAHEAGAELGGGRVQLAGAKPDLGAAEAGLQVIEARLAENPWAAPEQHELDDAGLGARELAAAVRLGRIIRLPGEIVLLPSAPALAMRRLSALPQPFTTSDARQTLDTTRRVAIPLLEHLDSRGWTRRLDGSRREVVHR